MTIAQHYELGAPQVFRHNKVEPKNNPMPNLLYGLELEIENLPDECTWRTGSMRMTEDGSLRNGMEFVLTPMTYSHVQMVLEDFYRCNRINESNFSERCSIHVHTNVQDLTFEQLASIALIYQVFERVLFRWIGNDRDRNIFCVPWYDTGNMTYQIVNRLKQGDGWVTGEWLKYTALNLIPVSHQGTIEWRHMHGHCDVLRIMQWLRFIGHIYSIATSLTFEQVRGLFVNLNTTSQYLSTVNNVFNTDADALKLPGYEADVEDGVLHMKYSLMSPPKTIGSKKSPNTAELLDLLRTYQAQPFIMEQNPPVVGREYQTYIFDELTNIAPERETT